MKIKYSNKNIDNIKHNIDNSSFISKCRISETNFIRNRKITPRDLILYELNKKGLSTKMEILNFNDINDVQNISSPGLLKQREKLNPEAFKFLIQDSLRDFYSNYKEEVKTIKGYVLLGIDGSDFEIPNNKISRSKYNGKMQKQVARVTVSTCYDLLNKYTLDVTVNKYNYSETLMAKEHCDIIKQENILDDFKSIKIMDRNYRNLSYIYHSIKNDEKFLIRIASSVYEKENQNMKSNDEYINIGYEYNRAKYYKSTDPELFEYLSLGNYITVRCVKIKLDNGEFEYLLTNLDNSDFSTLEIKELYNLRRQIEINYRHLKTNLKIESITSSKDILIKQDIYSQVLVCNMLQAFINENDQETKKYNYKYKVKTNRNMSIGIFKNTLIYILLEDDNNKRSKMMEKFSEAIKKYIIPIKPNRKNGRLNNPKNRYHINQRKTY